MGNVEKEGQRQPVAPAQSSLGAVAKPRPPAMHECTARFHLNYIRHDLAVLYACVSNRAAGRRSPNVHQDRHDPFRCFQLPKNCLLSCCDPIDCTASRPDQCSQQWQMRMKIPRLSVSREHRALLISNQVFIELCNVVSCLLSRGPWRGLSAAAPTLLAAPGWVSGRTSSSSMLY
jgi:hypothetical protein